MIRKGLILALLCTCCALAKGIAELEILTSKPTRCSYAYAFEMYGAHCAALHLDKIPSLKTSIEILDFSENKLRMITADTFSSYTNLKFLYLTDNQILNIHSDAFAYLTDLETLDLSKNIILDLPSTLFQLPNLRKLYLGGNPLIANRTLEIANNNKEISAPLELLDISDCKLEVLPDWGMLPQLLMYNISNNPLKSIDAKYFAVMCNLKSVDLSKSIADLKHPCFITNTMKWLQEKRVGYTLDADDWDKLNADVSRCQQPSFVDAYNVTFQNCKAKYSELDTKRTSRRTWLTVAGGLAGFLVGFMLLLFLMHRHNVSQTKTAAEKKPKHIDGDKNATAILLNNAS